MTIPSLSDLTDGDASMVVQTLIDVMKLSDRLARSGNSRDGAVTYSDISQIAHDIYVKCRDARDAMLFDQVTRETVARLSGDSSIVVHGMKLSNKVVEFIKDRRLIDAIKELREDAKCGLKEAKDAVEYARDHVLKQSPF